MDWRGFSFARLSQKKSRVLIQMPIDAINHVNGGMTHQRCHDHAVHSI